MKILLRAAATLAVLTAAVAVLERHRRSPAGRARQEAREDLDDANIERVLYFWSGGEEDPSHWWMSAQLETWCGCCFGECDCNDEDVCG